MEEIKNCVFYITSHLTNTAAQISGLSTSSTSQAEGNYEIQSNLWWTEVDKWIGDGFLAAAITSETPHILLVRLPRKKRQKENLHTWWTVLWDIHGHTVNGESHIRYKLGRINNHLINSYLFIPSFLFFVFSCWSLCGNWKVVSPAWWY